VLVRNLSKAYGYFWALRDVHLEFRQGDCVALLGPNGAGKTTLLKLLSALIYPTSGEIEFDGKGLGYGNSPVRSAIGFLSPHEHLYEKLTARENLRFFISLYDKNKNLRDVDSALDQVGLARWSDAHVATFSQGMKCRLTIAKWRLLEPTLLLLDEPYGVLDGPGIDLLEAYLRGLCRTGGIVIMATHHVSRILSLCSRALILHQGKIIFDEPRQEPWETFHRAFAEFLPQADR
jgi:heme ABC exporter ATP-binding subunit CcmA